MPDYIKYVLTILAILSIITTVIIHKIAPKRRFETGDNDLYRNVFYVMLLTSTILIYAVFFVYSYY